MFILKIFKNTYFKIYIQKAIVDQILLCVKLELIMLIRLHVQVGIT